MSGYVHNVTDERAFLSFDQERGTRARIGYLTNSRARSALQLASTLETWSKRRPENFRIRRVQKNS